MGSIVDTIKAKVLDKLDTPDDLLTFKLGSALKMENKVLGMLHKLEQEMQRSELKELFSHHADETRGQIENLEQAFSALGATADEKPCLPIDAIDAEATATIKMTQDRLVDAVILSGAAETEHFEIAVYESLIALAESIGKHDVAGLLRENLQQEEHTLDEATQAMQKIAPVMVQQAR
jgi:ferritin-like metal-binding protein YciE